MAIINFPDNPAIGEQFTVNGRTWEWTGSTWDTVETLAVTGPKGDPGTGFVNWTYFNANATLVKGQGAGCDTTDGGFTITLPTTGLVLGDTIAILDVANTMGYNFLTVDTGTVNINGGPGPLVINVPGAYLNLVYVDVDTGWRIF